MSDEELPITDWNIHLVRDERNALRAKLDAIEARCRFPDSVGNLRDAIQRIIHPEAELPGPQRIDDKPA